jgi:hypothetical protein
VGLGSPILYEWCEHSRRVECYPLTRHLFLGGLCEATNDRWLDIYAITHLISLTPLSPHSSYNGTRGISFVVHESNESVMNDDAMAEKMVQFLVGVVEGILYGGKSATTPLPKILLYDDYGVGRMSRLSLSLQKMIYLSPW